MIKVRVHELAKEINIEAKDLLVRLKGMGLDVKNHMSVLEEDIAEKIKKDLGVRKVSIIETRVKSTVIRRRKSVPIIPTTPLVEEIGESLSGAEPEQIIPESIEKVLLPSLEGTLQPPLVVVEKLEAVEERLKQRAIEDITKLPLEPRAEVLPLPAPAVIPEKVIVPKEITPEKEEEKPKKKEKMKIRFGEEGEGWTYKKRILKRKEIFRKEELFGKEGGEDEDIIFKFPKAVKKKVHEKFIPKKPEITIPKPIKRIVKISDTIVVGELAKKIGKKAGEVVKSLMSLGVMATVNQPIDADLASLVAQEFGYEVENVAFREEDLFPVSALPEKLAPRPPVVTIMGHVDHGKTSLLDAIRQSKIIEAEIGGITQHIGAYFVNHKKGDIVFLDTPGHEAFTAMRARGAKVTDIVVLVVASDDGVMPQTKEAIDHAKAAGVPIIVAINKIDKPNSDPERVKRQLGEFNVVPWEWGGDNLFVNVSAKKRVGLEELLDAILIQAEALDLKANPERPGQGSIIEAKLDKGRGPVATVLVQQGAIKCGDYFTAGVHTGRVRALINDRGQRMEKAGPSMPVEVIGLSGVPGAGDPFHVVEDEGKAKEISFFRTQKKRDSEIAKIGKIALEDLFEKIQKGSIKELNIILKADVHGSIEALKEALLKLSSPQVEIKIIHDGVGEITETDVMLAAASNAIILGFNVVAPSKVQTLAEQEKVSIRSYSIIYECVDDIKKAMLGLLEPTYKEKIYGKAEIKEIFRVPKVGSVAGCYVIEGKVVRGSKVHLLRDNVITYEGKLISLRRFKEDAREVQAGFECGMGIDYNDIKVGDIIECFDYEQVAPKLDS